MAEVAVDGAERPEVRLLAQAVVESQDSEIVVLRAMLDARGGPLRDGP
jgi:uncharacterized protein (DUF305 family)